MFKTLLLFYKRLGHKSLENLIKSYKVELIFVVGYSDKVCWIEAFCSQLSKQTCFIVLYWSLARRGAMILDPLELKDPCSQESKDP